jgi:Fe-S cluster assembly protein SufD
MVQTTDIPVMALKEQIIENHNEFLESLRHRFLDEDRKTALQKFENIGFPTKKTKNINIPI